MGETKKSDMHDALMAIAAASAVTPATNAQTAAIELRGD